MASTEGYDVDAKERENAWLLRRYPELEGGADRPNGSLGLIKLEFARRYAAWELSLPDEDVEDRRSGRLAEARGWGIDYRFGQDDGGEFVVVFARHRMTNDRLIRISETGCVELLGASHDIMANVSEESRAGERRFRDLVREHGFLEE